MAIISALVTQKCRIGVLTPYRAQQKLIDRMIKDEDLTASVDTIDASQGNCFLLFTNMYYRSTTGLLVIRLIYSNLNSTIMLVDTRS